MAFDYLVGELKCPVCGKISPCDDSTNMQTKIQAVPSYSNLLVGTKLDFGELKPELEIQDAGYFQIVPHSSNDDIVLLETWECPNCGTPYLWAKIVIQSDHIIKEISSVNLSKHLIKNSNYISGESISITKNFDASLNLKSNTDEIIEAILASLDN
jgi:hypothetical protein